MKERQMLDNETEHQHHPHNISVSGKKITNGGEVGRGEGDPPDLTKVKNGLYSYLVNLTPLPPPC